MTDPENEVDSHAWPKQAVRTFYSSRNSVSSKILLLKFFHVCSIFPLKLLCERAKIHVHKQGIQRR